MRCAPLPSLGVGHLPACHAAPHLSARCPCSMGAGHALYEQGRNLEYDELPVNSAMSMGGLGGAAKANEGVGVLGG